MIWLLANWRTIAILALVVAIAATGWGFGADSVQSKWDKATAQQVAAQLAKNQTDHAKMKTLEETKNANIVEIDRLRANLGKSERLRLRQTACSGSGKANSDNPAGEGQLPESVSGSAEDAINIFDREYLDEATRAEKIVESCRVLNDFVK